MIRHRFPGVVDGVARFDGPAGTLMVDVAIDAMRAHLADGSSANLGGTFAASAATGELVDGARATVAALLGTSADRIVFGANMTTLTFAFTRAVARQLEPGDEIVCTQLDHDANVTPWVLAARDRGARVAMAELDPETGRLRDDAIERCLTDRTRWVAVTGASNLLGSVTDLPPIIAAAHDAGARVFVDAVHLAPHRRIDVDALGCDALATSPYKWYGPHAGVLAVDAELLESLDAYKVRPAPAAGPRRLETGTSSFEAIAATGAAARFLLDEDIEKLGAADREVFAPLLDGLLSMRGVTVHGPQDLLERTPTVLFSVEGVHPDEVASHLARHDVAVWSGHSYAVEVADAMGLTASGVGVRAGVAGYTSADDVEQLLRAVDSVRR
ncbi:MAG TPA: cysteine desulfurase-like protein [Acidimicrobiales bacterium]|nr:cysteine desulfurase-like protein [Acidimicrobiales bacterium]